MSSPTISMSRAPAEHLEEGARLALHLSEGQDLGGHDRPRRHREDRENQQDRKIERSCLRENLDDVACPRRGRSDSAILHLQCKDNRAKRSQQGLRYIG
jgi:hypothetical protein